MKKLVIATITATSVLLSCQMLPAQEGNGERVIYVKRLDTPPLIDGVLNDGEWTDSRIETGDWIIFHPNHGPQMAQKTEVFAAYDDSALYFGFKCYDDEPGKIKSSVSRRDDIAQDDWICVMIDSLNNGQMAYEHFSNAHGIQYDVMDTPAGWDKGVDWVWQCAARLDDDGYSVEMRIPLKSIRFRGGSEARMGICFRRRVSRTGQSANWPDMPPGNSIFNVMATFVYRDLSSPVTREVLPSFTFTHNSERISPEEWTVTNSKGDLGVSVKYGITPSITLDAAYNPDFSQVESDEFQVEVNQRYPIFYTEKRPFFMEGMGYFQMPMAGRSVSMTQHIHTRRIVDPQWGIKLTGTAGKLSFASLTAADEAAGRVLDTEGNFAFAGKKKIFSINRIMYNMDTNKYIGGIMTDTEFASGHNRSVGMDFYFLGSNQRISGFAFHTFSKDPIKEDSKDGFGGSIEYAIIKRSFNIWLAAEHYDDDFQLDTAIYKRTGITFGHAYICLKLYPNQDKYPWFKMFQPFTSVRGGPDRLEGGTDFRCRSGFNMYFSRSGSLELLHTRRREPWAGLEFDVTLTSLNGSVQLTKQLRLNGTVSWSDSIFYSRSNPFPGDSNYQSFGFELQPTSRFNQSVDYQHTGFAKASSGEKIYDIQILNSKTTYQFNEQFFLRTIVQYNSYEHRILSDFLASYTLVPGTVVYAGYGSLIEKRRWEDDRWRYGVGGYLTTRRSFFFKASYLWRF